MLVCELVDVVVVVVVVVVEDELEEVVVVEVDESVMVANLILYGVLDPAVQIIEAAFPVIE